MVGILAVFNKAVHFDFVEPGFAKQIVEDKATRSSIIRLLSSPNENTLISALTTLFYLLEYPQGVARMF